MKKLLLTIFGIALLCSGLMAQTITPIPAGGTWSTARTTINANDEIASDSMAILQLQKAPIASPTFTGTVVIPSPFTLGATSVTSNGTELNVLDGALVTYQELNKLVGIGTDTIATRAYARLVGGGGSTDTTSLSARIDLKAPIAGPNFTGVPLLATNDTLATRSYARSYGGTGTVTVSDVRDEIADSLNVLRPLYVAVADTASMLTNYALLSETGTGGVVIGDVRDEIADSLNVLRPLYVAVADTSTMLTNYVRTGDVEGILNLAAAMTSDSLDVLRPLVVMVADTATMLANYALLSETGTGDVSIGDVRDEIADSLNVLRPLYIAVADSASMLTTYITRADTASMLTNYALTSELPAAGVSVGDVRDEIADSLNVLRPLYVAVADTSSMLTTYITRSDTASMLSKYLLSSEFDILDTRTDSIVDVLADTINIADAFHFNHITDTLDTKANVRLRLLKSDTASMLTTYITRADTASMLTNYALLSETSGGVLIGDVRGEIADSLNVLRGNVVMLADSTGGSGHYASWDDMTDGLALKVNVADSTGGSGHYASWDDMTDGLALKPNTTAVRLLVDTIPLFVFGAGGGNAGDTTLFTTTTIYGSFYNKGSDTLVVTELRVFLGHGAGLDTLGVQIWWNDTLNVETGASTVKLNTDALPIGRPSATTTGTVDTSFANSKIPPNVWVWCKTPYVPAAALKRKPVYMNAQISGYKIPKY